VIPGSASPFFLGSSLATATAGGLQIERSLRFNSSDSAYLSRTPAVAGNRRTWTWAGWVKACRFASGADQYILSAYIGGSTQLGYFDLRYQPSAGNFRIGGYNSAWRSTSAYFRDTSAWFHIVMVWDTTQGTASNRVKLYINGVQLTDFTSSLDPALND